MQDGTFKQGKGRNETGNSSTSTFIAHSDKARIYSHTENHASITVKAMKASKGRVTTEYLFTQLLKQVYFTRRRHHMHLYKSKGKSHPQRQGWQTGPWTKCTWSLDERPGPRNRRGLTRALVARWRASRNVSVAAPDFVPLAWPASSLRCSPRRHAFHSRHHGWGGERTGLSALSQHKCSVWGGLLMLGMGRGELLTLPSAS